MSALAAFECQNNPKTLVIKWKVYTMVREELKMEPLLEYIWENPHEFGGEDSVANADSV